MTIQKKYSDYKKTELSKIQKMQNDVNLLLSLDDNYYIAAKDAHNRTLAGKIDKEMEIHERYGRLAAEVVSDGTAVAFLLEPFKERIKARIQQKIQEVQSEIKKLSNRLAEIVEISQHEPVSLNYFDNWVYQDSVYYIGGNYSDEEKKLLVLEFADKERQKFERLKRKFSGKETDEIKYERTRIPEEVRIAVWRRDQGKCARCGNRENLEYDHIVPVSKGGGNTARNIELLCQNCNR